MPSLDRTTTAAALYVYIVIPP